MIKKLEMAWKRMTKSVGERLYAQGQGKIIAQGAAGFPALKKCYWERHFWGRGYFSTTNGAITEQTVLQYLEQHSKF